MTELQAQWIQSQGIEEADVSDVTVLDSTIFICTNGIWSRNINGGVWQQRLSGIRFSRIEVCGEALFAWGTYTCYRSLDHGNTWQDMNTYWGIQPIQTLCTIDSTLFFSNYNKIFRSDDQGTTIYPIVIDTGIYINSVESGGSESLFRYRHSCDYLFESIDKGITWDTISMAGLPSNVGIFGVSRLNGNIWLGANHTIYMRNDIQQQWVFNDSIYLNRMKILNGNLMVSTWFEGVYRLDTTVNQWFPENTGLETLTVEGFCDYAGGLFLATNIGPFKCTIPYNWEPFYDGLNQADISTVSFLGNEVWAVAPRGTFVSTDHGTTFTKHEMSGLSKPISLLLTDSLFYARTNNSFWISSDHGNSWVEENSGLPSPTQWPYLSLRSLVKQGGYLFLGTNEGIYRSPSQNIYWTKMISFTYQDNHPIYLFCDESTLFAVKEVYNNNYHHTFRSVDFGQTFDSVSLPVYYNPAFASSGNAYYALSCNQLFKSADAGSSWSTLPIGNPDIYGLFLAASQPALIVGGSKLSITLYDLYLAVTYDNGNTWTDIQENLPVPPWPVLSQLAINQQRTFASPGGYGLWYQDGLLTGIGNNPAITAGRLTVSPNPAKGRATLLFDLPEPCTAAITITGMTGRVLYQGQAKTFEKGSRKEQLNLKDMAPGIYIVSFCSDKLNLHCKLQITD